VLKTGKKGVGRSLFITSLIPYGFGVQIADFGFAVEVDEEGFCPPELRGTPR
jgi:hypothetical protein